jgi:acyl-CoA thioester hydrolase
MPVTSEQHEDLKDWFKTTLRVRYADTDRMGLVYHSNYFIYFEACRSDLIRQLWKSYSLIEEDGYLLLVIEAHCRFRKGAEYDDFLNVYAKISSFTETRLHFDYKIVREKDNQIIVEGYTEHCFADKNAKPCKMPEDLKKILLQKT